MCHLILTFMAGFLTGKYLQDAPTPPVNLVQKWHATLNYSSSYNGQVMSRPIPYQDRPLVAALLERAERYYKKNPYADHNNDWVSLIRNNYKNMTFDF